MLAVLHEHLLVLLKIYNFSASSGSISRQQASAQTWCLRLPCTLRRRWRSSSLWLKKTGKGRMSTGDTRLGLELLNEDSSGFNSLALNHKTKIHFSLGLWDLQFVCFVLQTRPEGSMGGLPMRWHPMMAARVGEVAASSMVEVGEVSNVVNMFVQANAVWSIMVLVYSDMFNVLI